MLKLKIPGFKDLKIKKLVFDYNGTLAEGGHLSAKVKEELEDLANFFAVYIITADTFGTVKNNFSASPVQIKVISSQRGKEEKVSFVKELNPEEVLAVGNGRNDKDMLAEAALGIGVLKGEGIATEALLKSDLICQDITEVFKLLDNPRGLKASLRG